MYITCWIWPGVEASWHPGAPAPPAAGSGPGGTPIMASPITSADASADVLFLRSSLDKNIRRAPFSPGTTLFLQTTGGIQCAMLNTDAFPEQVTVENLSRCHVTAEGHSPVPLLPNCQLVINRAERLHFLHYPVSWGSGRRLGLGARRGAGPSAPSSWSV